jgi:2-polyprenyl-3-methyl-5-hydroxy-6-metoxy-1,4-benzoquinol methylase
MHPVARYAAGKGRPGRSIAPMDRTRHDLRRLRNQAWSQQVARVDRMIKFAANLRLLGGHRSHLFPRATGMEWMDRPDFGRQGVMDTFRYLRPVNRWFGGRRPFLTFFRHESRLWDPHTTYRILDVGCGVGDVAIALSRWARRQGFHLHIHGIDKHPVVIELAKQNCQAYPEISLACQDLFALSGPTYDYVLTSQFLHHFPNPQVPGVLARLLALSQRKVVVNDLIRAPLAYAATWLFTLLTSEVFRHDARLSVRRGFTLPELVSLLGTLPFQSWRLERHFFYRFLLILSKREAS